MCKCVILLFYGLYHLTDIVYLWYKPNLLYDAIHLGNTSILFINIEKYVKMSQT